jgi:hypothetical protein
VLFVNGGSAVRPNPKVAGTSVAFAGESATRGMMHQAMAAENTEFERHRLLPGKRAWDPRQVPVAALPGVRLRGFARPQPNLVESFRDFGVQLHRQRAEVRLQLLGGRRSDNRGGDDRVPK